MLQGLKTMNDTNKDLTLNRRFKILEQRISGKSFRAIGKALKISHATAKRDYEQALLEQYENNHEEINRQRNKAQLILDKLIDSTSRYAFGNRVMEKDIIGREKEFKPEDHEYEEIWTNKESGKRITDHFYEEDHWDEDNDEWGCIGDTCEFKKRKLTQKEMEQVEAEWIENNSHFTKPDKDSQKTLIDCIKLMHNIWGFSTSTQTIFDQRKQTIHIEGEADESI